MSEASKFSNKEEAVNVPSEKLLATKRDQCLSNLVVNGSLGLCLGIGASVLLFRRRMWPVILGTGFGFGTAFADCQRAFHLGFKEIKKQD
ncbi:DUF543-domain-containing protein [Neoconidiobolus thromboides FSU 785]|nr:DUF543-domain-containing protein [Neoconidiobolus thromboides FSU 785]